MENTKIEWADHTANFWSGCAKVSPACANCYAETLATRLPTLGKWGKGAPRKRHTSADKLVWKLECQSYTRHAAWLGMKSEGATEEQLVADGFIKPRRPRVFVNSLSDWLDPEVPVEWLADLLAAIHDAPHLDFLLLTKRPELWRERIGEAIVTLDYNDRFDERRYLVRWALAWVNGTAPRNIWLGTTVEDQQRADERIPALLRIPARVRFLSCEPLLGPVDLRQKLYAWPATSEVVGYRWPAGIDWVIVGGESGHHARPMHPDWARSLRDQCKAAGVAFFFKQWGDWAPWQTKPNVPRWMGSDREFEDCGGVVRNFDRAAGRQLDGVEWSQLPEVLP